MTKSRPVVESSKAPQRRTDAASVATARQNRTSRCPTRATSPMLRRSSQEVSCGKHHRNEPNRGPAAASPSLP